MDLSVIIVNYNVKYFLEQCLCSVQKAITNIDAEIIVIDNHSNDGSLAYLHPLFPSVIFLVNEKNVGFGKANNIALLQAKGDFILFLNPDTIVNESCFTQCISFLKNNTNAGAAGVRMIDGSGKFLPESKRSFPSPLSSFYKLIGLASLFPSSKRFNHYALGHLDENKIYEIDVLAGAFLMIKKEVLEKVKGFDESFFMYGEDIDLSFRIQQVGYKIFYLGETTIIHFKGESAKKQNINYVRMFYAAMDIFVRKHYGGITSFFFSLFIRLAIALRTLTSLFQRIFLKISFSKTNAANDFSQSLIVGSSEEQKEINNLLQKNTLSGIDSLQNINQFHAIRKLIFCIGDLSYSAIIHFVQSNPAYRFRFHAKGSKSIVGSDSKKGSGETIAV